MNKFAIGVAALLFLATGNANATNIGYCKDNINRNIFRVGSSTQQGQVIRLSKAKLQALKGKTISSVDVVVGSKNTTGNKVNVFISSTPDATPLRQGTITISRALQKCTWTLDTPYTITGNEGDLYIGYTADIATTYKMLVADGSYDIKGYNFAYQDGKWIDTYGMNKGSAYIYVNVDNPGDYTDAIIGRNNFDRYFKAGNNYDFNARFINAGTTTIKSFDAVVKMGDKTSQLQFGGLDIKPKEGYSFKLQGINSKDVGSQDVNVDIVNINGDNSDIDNSDNSFSAKVFFYPHDMERSLLLEGFTGQDCSQCPSGHISINSAIENCGESIVEVSHHAGFYPDIFTMSEDDAYRFYYSNPASTFAPAVMVNRSADNSISLSPVVNAETSYIYSLIDHASQSKPYVSLNLMTELNEETRELKVKLQMKPHSDLPTDNVLFNIFLVQDSLQAYQSNGGTNYTHNRVFRGTLTGNSWGLSVKNWKAGEEKSWETTYTVPESIHSSYWTDDMLDSNGKYSGKYEASQTDIKAVLKNMWVVAYVGEYDTSDNTKNVVFNCCEAKLGESYKQKGFDATTGVDAIKAEASDAKVRLKDGKLDVEGEYDRVDVYGIDGRKIDADAHLSSGVYIVRVASGKGTATKKILVK